MNLDSLTNALSHIGLSVASLTKKNLNSSKEEIQKVSSNWSFIQCWNMLEISRKGNA